MPNTSTNKEEVVQITSSNPLEPHVLSLVSNFGLQTTYCQVDSLVQGTFHSANCLKTTLARQVSEDGVL